MLTLRTPVLPLCMFWTPNSQLLVCIIGTHASFVERQTCTARLQQTSLPDEHIPHCAMCSRAGLVVVAQLGKQQGIFSIGRLIGAPKVLEVLRQIVTGRVA